MEPGTPRSGMLLLSPPFLEDPNFRRTVVLLVEHDEEGSFGLVLNQPLDLDPGAIEGFLEGSESLLSIGGPVKQDTLHLLHRLPDRMPESLEVAPEIFWGGDFDVVKEMLASGELTTDLLRLFLGYSGWSPGQLQEEIDAGGWILTEVHPSFVFTDQPESLWRNVLRHMGGSFALLANFPDDPSMN
jgi:putative transcriptional regulator